MYLGRFETTLFHKSSISDQRNHIEDFPPAIFFHGGKAQPVPGAARQIFGDAV